VLHRAERLRAMVDRNVETPVLMVGVHHAAAAQLAAAAGFDACWISSLEVSAAMGLADQNLVGSAEMAAVAYRATLATDLPVVVDADNGYGSVLAMRRAAHEFAGLNIAGMCVEDSFFPKRNSFDPARDSALADVTEFASWIIATRRMLGGSPFLLMARTEALIAGQTVEEAVERAVRYAEAGADLIVVHSKDPTGQQAVEVAKKWPLETPLVSIPTAFPHLSPEELRGLGYRVVIYANQLLRASVAGMRQALGVLRDGRAAALERDIISMSELLGLNQ
jgi:phosphoenolpyruvate phosphomutase